MNYANLFGIFPKFPTILFVKIPKSPTIYFLKIPNSPAILSLDSPSVLVGEEGIPIETFLQSDLKELFT